ncbi:xanthine dehydrogenase family protein subunit M [Opitutales bacterium ASA1]|uniref:FAD binding domain-containing protein n=1 Tax=Congregicoccus parvus TaxID=3081749 RepID=UPI002B28310A|nr:xanthine dehydrogenase family protein subunit M [Opitutales bacterium ASA1]
MQPFTYMRAGSIESAVAAASDRNRYIAGGIDLLGEMKEGIATPAMLISVLGIPSLDTIERTASGWRIGANVTLTTLAGHEALAASVPAVVEAARGAASPQIRNVSTVAGNLAQHSRCWYYRHRDVPCLKKGGSTCFAQEGENKYHNIFGESRCISPVVSNLATALSVLEAVVFVQRKNRTLRWTTAQLYETAWRAARAHNSLLPGDMITAIEIPYSTARCTYLQQAEKSGFDWALVSCAACVETGDDGRVRAARVALGAVAPVPYRDAAAERALVGKTLDETSAYACADQLLRRAKPLDGNGYKVPIARALIKRALLAAAAVQPS